jgi:SRSO17 transposase
MQAYDMRWNIEKFFRTAKQKLGLQDCLVRNLSGQQNHIRHVFFAYAFLQIEKFKRKLKNTESVLKSIHSLNFERLKQRFVPIIQNFCYA